MYKFAKMSNKDRDFVFNTVALQKGLTSVVVEKDFWVCLTLDYLFNKSKYKDCFTFKGGTSLSKGFGIINRFSEDIDIILDWRALGFREDEPLEERSRTKQNAFNYFINEAAVNFIKNELLEDIRIGLGALLGQEVNVEIDAEENQVINFYYPQIHADKYILKPVRLEIGPLAAWTPSQKVEIKPFVCENLPTVFEQNSTTVLTVLPERTFWEKATILHREANRALDKPIPQRYSRHYYDLYRIAQTDYLNTALENRELLKKVVLFKKKFYYDGWSNYDDCLCGKFKLVPPQERISELKKDYDKMHEMLFGTIPSFEEILAALATLENRINF